MKTNNQYVKFSMFLCSFLLFVTLLSAEDQAFQSERTDTHEAMKDSDQTQNDFHVLSGQEEEQLTNFLKIHFPLYVQELQHLKENKKQMYAKRSSDLFALMNKAYSLQKEDPHAFQKFMTVQSLDYTCIQLIQQIHDAEAMEKISESQTHEKSDQLKAQLRNIINRLFEIKEEKRLAKLKELEKEIEVLKEAIDTRQKNKELIVNRRFQELLGEQPNDHLKWD